MDAILGTVKIQGYDLKRNTYIREIETLEKVKKPKLNLIAYTQRGNLDTQTQNETVNPNSTSFT